MAKMSTAKNMGYRTTMISLQHDTDIAAFSIQNVGTDNEPKWMLTVTVIGANGERKNNALSLDLTREDVGSIVVQRSNQ